MDKPPQQNTAVGARGALLVVGMDAIAETVGRRGVRLYGLSRPQLAMVWVGLIFTGIPAFALLAALPIWERVGEVWWIAKLNEYVAPAIGTVASDYRPPGAPHYPMRRVLIAATTVIELLVLANFASMFFRKVRKHALLVWLCFDRQKLFLFLAISGSAFAAIWYAFFYDWQVLEFLGPNRSGQRLITFAVMTMPSLALVFGHLLAIVSLGLARSASKMIRLFLRNRRRTGKIA